MGFPDAVGAAYALRLPAFGLVEAELSQPNLLAENQACSLREPSLLAEALVGLLS